MRANEEIDKYCSLCTEINCTGCEYHDVHFRYSKITVMKSKEAPKSKFVYPDKLYARTNNNITLDISYAPQTLEAVEYVRTDAFIEKACDWLFYQAHNYTYVDIDYEGRAYLKTYSDKMLEDFRKYMEGE